METVSSENIPYFATDIISIAVTKLRSSVARSFSLSNVEKPQPGISSQGINGFLQLNVTELPTLHSSQELKPDFYDPLSYMMAIDYQTYMVDDILQKVDRATCR